MVKNLRTKGKLRPLSTTYNKINFLLHSSLIVVYRKTYLRFVFFYEISIDISNIYAVTLEVPSVPGLFWWKLFDEIKNVCIFFINNLNPNVLQPFSIHKFLYMRTNKHNKLIVIPPSASTFICIH